MAAIAGALAGSFWGLSGIPQALSSCLQSRHPLFTGEYPTLLIELADSLTGARPR